VKSSVAPLEGNKVKLSVEVDETELERDIDVAFRKIAQQVRLPGFRPGKAPRRILEARIGIGPAREQALRDAIPSYLAQAVRSHDVDIIAPPEIDITAGQEDGPLAFDATIEVRPQVLVPGYAGLRVELPNPAVTDEALDEAVAAELRRHGELEDVDRPAASGDHVTLDISGTRDGEPVAGLTTEDWLYEIGRGWVAEGFDDRLIGTSAGDELAFTANPTGTDEPADFEIAVKAVQALRPPDLTDEWVAGELGEWDNVQQWKDSLRERMQAVRANQARALLLERVSTALAELVDEEPPEALVQTEVQSRAQGLMQNLQAQGIGLEQYLTATGQDPAAFGDGLKEGATRAVKVDLALRAVADAEGIEVTDDDLGQEYARIAVRVNQKASQVRKAYERNDAVAGLRAELRKSKALDFLLHRVEIVDPDGAPIARELVVPDHDHDDHDIGDHGDDHGDGHGDADAGGADVDAPAATPDETEPT
jgi:trigger factor